jgi:hypothetical protein
MLCLTGLFVVRACWVENSWMAAVSFDCAQEGDKNPFTRPGGGKGIPPVF